MDRERTGEVLRFAAAGAAGFAVELAVLYLLREKLGMDTLLAAAAAFIVSVVVNYLMCALWVFRGAKEQDGKSKAAFFLTSAAGLAINEGMMLLFRALWGEDAVCVQDDTVGATDEAGGCHSEQSEESDSGILHCVQDDTVKTT